MKDGTFHPATAAILQHFSYDHLPEELQYVSAPFFQLAHSVATGGTSGPETTTCLRKLLEAKDCAVRAARTERQ
jgi:hypothetical protein